VQARLHFGSAKLSLSEAKMDVPAAKAPDNIAGLTLMDNFITAKEHDDLLRSIQQQRWSTQLSRRVMQFGWAYSYSRTAAFPDKTTPIPDFMQPVCNQLVESKWFSVPPDQIIVNEYKPGQGIAAHTDNVRFFSDTVASLTLASHCIMILNNKATGETHSLYLRPRSLLVLSGEARYDWTHEIKKIKKDEIMNALGKQITVERGTRVSVTFRNMKSTHAQ
jgi:alkylated DNA repair dioxygenase AlkB